MTYVSCFITGMVLAYIRSWRLAIVLSLTIIPCVAVTGAVMNKFVSVYKQ